MILPDMLIFAQHGWSDHAVPLARLVRQAAPPGAHIIAPNLGMRTWLRMEPLIAQVSRSAEAALRLFPQARVRIVGHSMGGLIWLEVLHRRPDWLARVESLVLIASPVGGAHLGRVVDPFGWGIGIARDLGQNRRALAEAIARCLPTLVIQGDLGHGSDSTVASTATTLEHAHTVRIPFIRHARLRDRPAVADVLHAFWAGTLPQQWLPQHETTSLAQALIHGVQAVPGMTDAPRRGFAQAQVMLRCVDGTTLRTYDDTLGLAHVFVAGPRGDCLYAGYVGWVHRSGLHAAIRALAAVYAEQALCQEAS